MTHPVPTQSSSMACTLPFEGSDPVTGQSIVASACTGDGSNFTEPTLGEGPFHEGFKRAFTYAMGHLKQEPRSILHIGGCRQRKLARYLAFMFPVAKMTLVDPDPQQVAAAQEYFHCRFQFETTPLAQMNFRADQFDLVVAHNVFEFTEDWAATMAAIGHCAKDLLIVSTPTQGILSPKWAKWIPGASEYLEEQGVCPTAPTLSDLEFMVHIRRYGRPKQQFFPYPWRVLAVPMLAVRESKTVLAGP